MLVKTKPLFCITLLFGLLLPMHAYAIAVADGQFDQFIQNAEIVIKAQVAPQKKSPFEKIAFKAEVTSILKSDGKPIPENLSLESASPIWPDDMGELLAFGKKHVVLLVLRRSEGELFIQNHSGAILPATISKIDHKSDSIQRKVFDELHAFLPQARDKVSQSLVLVHLSY